MRGVCKYCTSTKSGTCKPPPAGTRVGTKKWSQGRPLGLTYAWCRFADAGPHTSLQHRAFIPTFEQRRAARLEAAARPEARDWLDAERPVHDRDIDGEPDVCP